MDKDPYKVLGVSRNASDAEVKKRYRDISRKYHPDSYADNPLADLAAEKFREAQEAYNRIMEEREKGYSQGTAYGGAYDGDAENDSRLVAALNYINAGRCKEALNVLNGIENRGARWYFFSAIANVRLGNNAVANEHARRAAELEPGNPEYVNFYRQLQFGRGQYQSGPFGGGYGNQPATCGTGNICCDLWCADTLCECMGGDLCACC